MPAKEADGLCVDCRSRDASLEIRRRRLCQDCFIRYIISKVLKRLESYRLKKSNQNSCRKVLLPLSGGISSLSLLHIVDQQLQKQITQSRGRPAYELHVLIVTSPLLQNTPDESLEQKIKDRYPTHSVSTIPLSKIADLDPDAFSVVDSLRTSRTQIDCSDAHLTQVFRNLESPTAKADILEVLLTRLIVAFGSRHDCESIFWGHSDSRLAARALSSVAKGRGSAMPFQLLDGPTPYGLTFNFPVRDLFKAELDLFSTADSTFPSDLVVLDQPATKVVSVRDLSIDQLITNYITSQGEKYPSIMANVVRTAGKLVAPEFTTIPATCVLCGLLADQSLREESTRPFCYGCARSLQSMRSKST